MKLELRKKRLVLGYIAGYKTYYGPRVKALLKTKPQCSDEEWEEAWAADTGMSSRIEFLIKVRGICELTSQRGALNRRDH